MDNLDINWIAVAFNLGNHTGNITPFSKVFAKQGGGVNNPDLAAWLIQQAIVLPDGFPQFVFIGHYDANAVSQMEFFFQDFRVINDVGTQFQGITKFDEIDLGTTQINSIVVNGYLVDRLIP